MCFHLAETKTYSHAANTSARVRFHFAFSLSPRDAHTHTHIAHPYASHPSATPRTHAPNQKRKEKFANELECSTRPSPTQRWCMFQCFDSLSKERPTLLLLMLLKKKLWCFLLMPLSVRRLEHTLDFARTTYTWQQMQTNWHYRLWAVSFGNRLVCWMFRVCECVRVCVCAMRSGAIRCKCVNEMCELCAFGFRAVCRPSS